MQPNHSTTDAIACYARVSSDDQAERETIKAQLDFLHKYVDLHGLAVADFYVDDGISGTIPLGERPEGQRLLADAEAGRFGTVVVYRLDRLARKLRVLLDAHTALDTLGVAIRSGTEPVDTSTPIGRFIFQLLGSMAELEKETIVERMTGGRDRLARDGRYTGGALPYGYDLGPNGCLTPSLHPSRADSSETEADVVRDLFARIAGGSTTMTEAKRLNALGVVPVRRYSNGRAWTGAGVWDPSRVGALIRSPVYRGEARLRSRRGTITYQAPPLVEEAVWTAAVAQLAVNRSKSRKNAKRHYLLSGLVRCGNCDHAYTGNMRPLAAGTGETAYYRCTSNLRPTAGQPRCGGRSMNAAELEAEVWQDCAHFIRNPGDYLAQAQAQLRDRLAEAADAEAGQRDLLAQIAAKDTEAQRVLTFARRGRISMDQADAELATINEETSTLRALLGSLRSQAALTTAAEAHIAETATHLAILRDDIDAIEAMPEGPAKTARKRQAVEWLVYQITVTTDLTAPRRGRSYPARVELAYAGRPVSAVVVERGIDRSSSQPSPMPSTRRSPGPDRQRAMTRSFGPTAVWR